MRSNGAVHIGNDTFMACSRKSTGNVFLVTSRLVEERVTPFPLERHVRFCPHESLESPEENIRQSLHESFDGERVAVIGTGTHKHYIIDVLAARVCEFNVEHPVISVAWHPVNRTLLLLLLTTGELLVLHTDKVLLSVQFKKMERVFLHDLVEDCKHTVTFPESNEAAAPLLKGIQDARGRVMDPRRPSAALGWAGEALITADGCRAHANKCEENTMKPSKGVKSVTEEKKWAVPQRREITAGMRELVPAAVNDNGGSKPGPSDLVGMCVVPSSRSLPTMLVLLCRNGDVFSLKLGNDGLPTSLSKDYDGSVGAAFAEETPRRRGAAIRPCVHYLVCGGNTSGGSEEVPLAIGTALLDEDVGLHVVYILYSSGVLRGCFFDEPDLLCRDLMRKHMDMSAVLGAAVPRDHILLCSSVDMCRLASLHACGNAVLIRYGDEVYLCVWPVWSRSASGWLYRTDTAEGSERLPVISHQVKVPDVVAVRLPYNACGASIAAGPNDILIFPEVYEMGTHDPLAPKPMTVKIANIVVTALYALGEKFVLTTDINARSGRSSNESVGSTGKNDEKDTNSARTMLETLLQQTALACRQWLCRHPKEEIKDTTAKLLKGVEGLNAELRARQLQQLERQTRLQLRVEGLRRRQQELSTAAMTSTNVVCDAIVHRRGVSELYSANAKLGKIHEILTELRAEVTRREAGEKRGAEGVK
uniref:Uncharacterized protein TCIL3000_8_6090 n=1 Tax=Trypanosoma congolense (strain IL3000) TaxID=1068625 RepID=G0USL9_TRYCI|nr:unnamed protein product [Trypanosoma congolense IL3000]